MPDVLDHVSIRVEAGLASDAALSRAADGARGPLGEELVGAPRDISISIGMPRKQAFINLAERTDIPELRLFVLAVNQAEAFGIPIAQVMRVQSRGLRVIRRSGQGNVR